MGVLYDRSNDALSVNPPDGDVFLTTNGSNWLFAATAIFLLSFLLVIGLSFRARSGEKIFHYIFAISLFVAGITYFAFASDLGYSVVAQSQNTDYAATRQVFWVKHVNWAVEWPAVVLVLGLASGISWATIIYQIFLTWIWNVSYLVASYISTNYKWGFYAFGTFAFLLLASNVAMEGRLGSRRVGITSHHALLTAHSVFFWLMYPIAWGVSDGGNKIGGTGSAVWYGIIDVLLLVGVTVVTLFFSRKWDYSRMNLQFTQFGRVPQAAGTHPEKDLPGHHHDPQHVEQPAGATSAAPAQAMV